MSLSTGTTRDYIIDVFVKVTHVLGRDAGLGNTWHVLAEEQVQISYMLQ